MEFLKRERTVLERHSPGLDHSLSEHRLGTLEGPDSPAIRLFRDAGGPGLLVPRDYGGAGISALEAIYIQRALASRSPSLGLMSAMHQFSIATLVEMLQSGKGCEGILLQAIVLQKLLVASALADEQTGRSGVAPMLQARRGKSGLLVSGSLKPCSMARSMDLLIASVALPMGDAGLTELAVAVIPSSASGIERRKFWCSPILAAAQSDEVVLSDVEVPERLIFYAGSSDKVHPVHLSGLLWVQMLMAASYVGVASALVEHVLQAGAGGPGDRAWLAIEVEGAMSALESVAYALMSGRRDEEQLARVLCVRYAVEQAIHRVSGRAVELLGGRSFMQSSDASYLLGAAYGLTCQPPSRESMVEVLVGYFANGSMKMQ